MTMAVFIADSFSMHRTIKLLFAISSNLDWNRRTVLQTVCEKKRTVCKKPSYMSCELRDQAAGKYPRRRRTLTRHPSPYPLPSEGRGQGEGSGTAPALGPDCLGAQMVN